MESGETISQLKKNQIVNKKRAKETCKDSFIRQSIHSVFAGNMSIERFLSDVAEFEDNYQEENVDPNSLFFFFFFVIYRKKISCIYG